MGSRFIPIHDICEHLGNPLTRLLLPFHALTGCDSTSCFKGRGKKSGWKLLTAEPEMYLGLMELGERFDMPAATRTKTTELVCRMYQPKSEVVDINILRYKIFCRTPKQNDGLPPCKDSLDHHIDRANYQCAIWKRAREAHPHIPSPVNHGWSQDGDSLVPLLVTQAPAPSQLVELTT